MNRDEAKLLLQVCRPGGQDADDPEFAAALKLAADDPLLGRWFAEEQSFDASLSRELKEAAVPGDLKESILADRKLVKPTPWWDAQSRAAAVAVAAAMVALLGLGGWWFEFRSASFAGLRDEIVRSAWNGEQHLDLRTSELKEVREWLNRHDAGGDFELPLGLRHLPVVGARSLDWKGHKVGMVCFLDGPMHMHLFVTKRTDFSDTPVREVPQFEDCDGWKTVSWSQVDKSYVLSGMNYQTVVKRFRKSGHWTWAG